MKFTNTKVQVKEVGTNAVAFGKAGCAFVKSIVKVPVAVGKDISVSAKQHAEEREAWKKWRAERDNAEA